MLSYSLITVALAGAATAFTPPGFQPASTQDLAVSFNGGAIKAMNGVNLPQADTTSPPELGTPQKMSGTYTLLMVDADIPPSTPGGSTTELLHWMQPGLVSAATTSTIAGQKVFALTNPMNTSALATYIAPNPPNVAPTSHRYVQMLLNTTGLVGANMTMLMKEAATRTNFNAANVLKANGLTVLMANWFNVTNAAALNSTSASNSTGQGVAGGAAGGATGATTATTAKTTSVSAAEATTAKTTSSAAAAQPKGSANGINSATLTTDALLKPGYNSTGAPSKPTSPAAAESPKATGPINSATLTTDVLISTGGAQQAGVAATTGASASTGTFKGAAETQGVGYLLAGVGAFAAAVVVL